MAPCILFIDEFDYVAKMRTSDEHAAIKRAVNTLLKAIDDINLVNDRVLLIAKNESSIHSRPSGLEKIRQGLGISRTRRKD